MGKLLMKFNIVINYSKSLKKSKSYVNKDIYNAARYELQKMIFNKKSVFWNKLTESIGKLKDVWKALESIGSPNKVSSCEVKALNTMLTQY